MGTIQQYFDEMLQTNLITCSWYHLFSHALFRDSAVWSLVIYQGKYPEYSKMVRGMEYMLRCVNITFVTTLIVYYYYPDTGKCQSATSQRICHSFVALNQNSKLCEWNDRYIYCEMKPM